MTSWTAHVKPGREPVLVKEGFAWGAFLFGPLWLLARRAWLAALVLLVLTVAAGRLVPAPRGALAAMVLWYAAGLFGRDVVRWTLGRRGYRLEEVLAARDEDAAVARLLGARPELAAGYAAGRR